MLITSQQKSFTCAIIWVSASGLPQSIFSAQSLSAFHNKIHQENMPSASHNTDILIFPAVLTVPPWPWLELVNPCASIASTLFCTQECGNPARFHPFSQIFSKTYRHDGIRNEGGVSATKADECISEEAHIGLYMPFI